ncbi:sensor histidine kinase [Cohnella cholangitidis]|uniref:histidine kinase n=1 Tax=Cohnella cholangitidis TaxID=2598458 RepID=A0A7G5C0R6_9BACL|nr:ATP-binding protein [Cohnella cholangitidis]QMV42800.1 HAMP domain-containing histidine kinase [Cohnella cholangitidis]
MSLRAKLAIGIGSVSTLTLVAAVGIGYAWGNGDNDKASNTVYWVVSLFSLSVIWVLSFGVAQMFAGRVKYLLNRAQGISSAGVFQEIRVKGNDEIAELATLFNKISGEWIKGEEVRNQLVSDAAHELRTPVAILRGHLETMLRGALELKHDNLISLLDETKRMTHLIQELQQISLAESGRLKLDRSWTKISFVLREVVDIFTVDAEEKQVRLVYEEEADCEIYCDISRIKQVLINIIGNAIRYTPELGTVRIRQSQQRDGKIRIEVADTGPGIPPDRLPYIFHRFYRVDDSRSRSIGGTGLGLAIAKQFAEAHGGVLEAFSEEGKGTTIILQLPTFPEV